MLKINDINHAIIAGTFTNEQLNSIAMAVKFARNQIANKNKFTMRVGSNVKFTGTKNGSTIYGIVEKVNRKYIIVRENNFGKLSGTWRVPANMLEIV